MSKIFVVTAYRLDDSFTNHLVGVYNNYLDAWFASEEESRACKGYACEIVSVPLNKRITDDLVVVLALPELQENGFNF
jgi:uncharacterized protein YktB (UPF0637 family)